MFKFESSSHEKGSDIRRRFIVELVKYAFFHFKTKRAVSLWLGIPQRTLYVLMKKHIELNGFIKKHPTSDKPREYWERRRLLDGKRND